ncbi:tetratricopeptide repeat protein [Adhaeretor mobilis]|uniref:Tetratricopeptide repeat protein n=1 Tax=Adhaeretor mobilis TaxID=1930276 RepID=A0A517N024_9BACT|nr:tetratricopeptide repeat protein [Adhaeretor mobilis]QDT00489.1 tetratricopeptide repeat protein [Adhaeretor mobilis]
MSMLPVQLTTRGGSNYDGNYDSSYRREHLEVPMLKEISRLSRPLLLLVPFLLLGLIACFPHSACAQLTTENLIGDSVSLSNRSYPEVEDAIQRFRNKDVDAARAFLDRAKEKYPKLPPTDITLAKMHIIGRDGSTARILLEKAATNSPDDPEAYLLLADDAFTSGRTTEAAVLFDKAGELTEAFTDNAKRKGKFEIRVLAGRAGVAERRQQWETAAGLLKNWIEMDAESAPAHQRLGITQFRLGQFDEARSEFKRARELREEFNHPEVVMGRLYAREGKDDLAKQAYQTAYSEDGDNEDTARSYAEYLLREEDISKASEVSQKLLAKNPKSIRALLLDGVIAKLQGDMDRAETDLNKILTIDPANADANNVLALLLVDSDDEDSKQKALRYAQVNAQRFPKSPQARVTLAWVLHKMGNDREAQQTLQNISGSNLSSDSGYLVSQMIADLGKRDQARKMLTQVLKQSQTMILFETKARALLEELEADSGDEE